ncbi:MAG: hypothetical protein HXX13_15420 [Bacteroidetes bacterium]|nr:hypothetical protein [Bacteroidota bacterium]
MFFESTGLYHIYNQGNNKQLIFFNQGNYSFFLNKIKLYINPFADILAWCLMPNHFHLMIFVRDVEMPASFIVGVTQSHPDNTSGRIRKITLNSSIGIMLRSYTRAINKQENRSGALFREETKAICLNDSKVLKDTWYTENGSTIIKVEIPEFQYPQICFDYIHNNPVRSGIVNSPEKWQHSSFSEIVNSKKDSVVNLDLVKEFGLLTGSL